MLPADSIIVLASVLLVITAQEWTKSDCPAPRSPANGVHFIFNNGKRVQFRCHPGFKMSGSNLADCTNNRWSHMAPRCIPINAIQEPLASTDEVTSPYSRSVFNWQEENDKPLPVVYGAGSNRLPIINGLWGYPAHRNGRVISIVPDPYNGNAVKAKDLLQQEMNIAALRNQLEKEVLSSRHIEPTKETPFVPPYYSPYKINSDGYLVGIGGVNSHPVYYLGASADHKVDEQYKNTRIGPELAELRRKQIEEARNIQMNAANNRQRSRFQNTLTYGTKDIPVWKGRQSPGRYWSEETVYKPARVEMSKYAEQNRFYVSKPSNVPLIPKHIPKKTQEVPNTEIPYHVRTQTTTKNPGVQTQTSKSTKLFHTLTPETVVVNIPTPPVLSMPLPSPVIRIEQESPSVKNRTVSSKPTVNVTTAKTNLDDFEWPPEALWFKYPTTERSKIFTTTRSHRIVPPRRSSQSRKPRGRGRNKKRDEKQRENRPQVTHFSHGRVKSTDPKGKRRI